jgi:hypothetical protein
MELAQRVSRVWLGSAGLVVVLACSSASPGAKAQAKAGVRDTSGSVPVSETKSDSVPPSPFRPCTVSVAPAPASEVQDVLHRFPKLAKYNDGKEIDSIPDRLFRLNRLVGTDLAEAFPTVRFYNVLSARTPPEVNGCEVPPEPYLIAVTADTFYDMYIEFNRLLFATGSLLTDSNIVKTARACVTLDAIVCADRDSEDPLRVPQIVILDAREIKRTVVDGFTYDVYVKTRVGDEVQERYIENRFRQFRSIYMKNPHLEEDMKGKSGDTVNDY